MEKDLSIIGNKYGHLTILDYADDEISSSGSHITKVICQCDCGAMVTTRLSSLKSGHTKGCGQKHRKVQDLTGQKFGKLTVIERADDYINKDGTKHIMWKCRCDCGNETITRGTSLRNGHCVSCGCAHHDSAMGVGLKDLTGQKFGRWTVMYENGRLKEPRGRLVPLWHCKCECGTERDIRGGTLVSGNSLSCGCYKYDALSKSASEGFGISKAESIVLEYLNNAGLYFESQKIYPDLKSKSGYPLSYDFLVYKDGVPFAHIECQGVQHYQPVEYFGGEKQFKIQQDNDLLKKKYSMKLHLPLIEVPYTISTKEAIFQLLDAYLS